MPGPSKPIRLCQRPASPSRRGGVTLIELLVVISLIVMVTAATIPVVAPAMANRRIRESARLVSSYIAGAKNRAAEVGRPVGVIIEKFSGQAVSMNLSYAEVPVPWGGDFANSLVNVTNANGVVSVQSFVPDGDGWKAQLIRPNDLIKLNYKGPLYYITGATNANGYLNALPWTLTNVNPAGPPAYVPPGAANGIFVPFQIFRQPSKSAVPPLQLPEGTVIDLTSSGWGLSNAFPNGTAYPVLLTFTPGGRVDSLYYDGQPVQRPTAPVNFLIGRREAAGLENLQDPKNLWISIGSLTGKITTTENTAGASGLTPAGLATARQIITSHQDMGER